MTRCLIGGSWLLLNASSLDIFWIQINICGEDWCRPEFAFFPLPPLWWTHRSQFQVYQWSHGTLTNLATKKGPRPTLDAPCYESCQIESSTRSANSPSAFSPPPRGSGFLFQDLTKTLYQTSAIRQCVGKVCLQGNRAPLISSETTAFLLHKKRHVITAIM